MAEISEALTRYKDALDALRDQRNQIREDLAFSDPSNPQQWDEAEKRQRETDPGGARPCLVMDQTGQYVSNVAGQVEQRPPALHSIPSNGGNIKVAEQLDGFYRQIEYASRAQQHYARALTSAARAGVGYLVIRPEYTDRALNWQEPRISSEGDPLRVVFDPWSVEIDGSDADYGYILTPYSHTQWERLFGKADKVSFSEGELTTSTDKRESVWAAEEWWAETQSTNMLVCLDAQGLETALSEDDYWLAHKNGEQYEVRGTYKDKKRVVKWRRISGAEELTKQSVYPSDSIGIVPVYGYVGWSDGRMTYCGIPRRARSAQQAYNYHISEMRVLMSQAPKSPWLAPVRAIRGLEKHWDRASVESRAYLPYHDVDPETGAPIEKPDRTPNATNLQNHIQGSQQALHDIQASIGMYQANLGAPSNETSGVAIDSRKQQGEASTAHFPSHLAASLGQVGKICMEMVPRLIDTKRQVRILGMDKTPGLVTVDPSQKEALVESPQGLSINPNVGRYDVRVTVGASYSTQRQQAHDAYTEMIRSNPQMMAVIGPLWAQTLDVPYADKLAQVLTAVAPDPVKAILQPESSQQATTAELQAKLAQMQEALKEAIQHAQDAQADADQAQQECQALKAQAEAKEDEVSIKAYDAQTNRLKVTGANAEQIQQIVLQMLNTMLSHPDPLPGEGPGPDGAPMHEMAEGEPQSYEMQPFPAELPEPNAEPEISQ